MRRVLAIWAALIGMAACLLGPATASAATPAVTLSPTTGHPSVTTTVTGSGFGVSEAVDVYFDTTDELLAVTSSTGGFSVSLTVPASAQPGVHWVTAVGRTDGLAAQAKFTVRTNWPAFGGLDTRNQRANPYENTLTASTVSGLDEAWHFDPGTGIDSSPAIVNGLVYVGAENGKVYALNASSGTVKWSFATGANVYSSPAVSGGTAYIGSENGHVYALNATTGAVKWNDDLSTLEPGGFIGSPTVSNGTVYIGGDSGNLYFLSTTNGFSNHVVATGGVIESAPAVANGVVYIQSGAENLKAFDASTAASKWSLTIDADNVNSCCILPGPAVANGRVFFDYNGGGAGESVALRVKDGGGIWANGGGAYIASPAVSGGVAYFADESGSLGAFRANDGSGSILASEANPFTGSPCVAGGVVYASGIDGVIYAFRQSDGVLLWSGQAGSENFSSPAVSDGSLYVSADDGVYAFSLGTAGAAVVRPAAANLHPNLRLRTTR